MLENKKYEGLELSEDMLDEVAGGRAERRQKKTSKIMCHHCGTHITYDTKNDNYVKCPKCGMKIAVTSNNCMRG